MNDCLAFLLFFILFFSISYVETVDDRIDTRLARDNPNAFNEQSSTKTSSYTHSDIQQKHSLSSISSKLSVNSTHPDHLSNQSSQTSRTNTIPMNLSKQQAQLTATDSNSNEHIVLSNRENISAYELFFFQYCFSKNELI